MVDKNNCFFSCQKYMYQEQIWQDEMKTLITNSSVAF